MTPYAHNGNNTVQNVVPACPKHNYAKHTGPVPVPTQPLLLTIAPAKNPRKKRS
jgi:hypothetical protein